MYLETSGVFVSFCRPYKLRLSDKTVPLYSKLHRPSFRCFSRQNVIGSWELTRTAAPPAATALRKTSTVPFVVFAPSPLEPVSL